MAFVPNEYLIMCVHCGKRLFFSDSVMDYYTKKYAHKNCADKKDIRSAQIPVITEKQIPGHLLALPSSENKSAFGECIGEMNEIIGDCDLQIGTAGEDFNAS